MRVLLFIDSLVGAGAQRQLVNLALGLDARGHEVTLATYAPKDFFRSRLDGSGVAYLNFGKRHRFDPMPVWHLSRTVDRVSPDVLISFLRTPCVYAELVRLRHPSLPLIVSERAGVDVGGLGRGDRLAGTLHRLATRVTANSHAYLDALLAARPALRTRSRVIYNGIDAAFLANGERRLAALRDDGPNALASSPIRLCVVAARATRQKAPLVLARAVAELRRRGVPAFTLDWIGPVDEDSALVRQTVDELAEHRLETIWRWAGAAPNAVDVYPRYDALVSSSLFEGVANTMCEAMASALPVVVTDIADNARIVRDGEAGFVCPVDDPSALADALQRFLELDADARAALGRRAHERAVELFSLERFVDRWEALCRDVTRPSMSHGS